MKKLFFIFLFSCSTLVYSQNTDVSQVLDIFKSAWDEMDHQREVGGYTSDINYQFNPLLKLVLYNKLNKDSLITQQKQLPLITVNDGLVGESHHMNSISFLKQLNFNQYSDTLTYAIDYESTEIRDGVMCEIVRIYKNNKRIRRITIEYESYSNLIRLIRDHYEQ